MEAFFLSCIFFGVGVGVGVGVSLMNEGSIEKWLKLRVLTTRGGVGRGVVV